MTNPMIERVAKAIEAELAQIYNGILHGNVMGVDGEVDLADLARAAIEAMRGPTEAVVRAGYATDFKHVSGHDIGEDGSKELWAAMIDAALKEN